MERAEILSRLRGVLEDSATEAVDWDQLGDATTVESLGFDSLSILDVLYGIEQELGVELDAGDVMDLKTVGELVTLLSDRGAA